MDQAFKTPTCGEQCNCWPLSLVFVSLSFAYINIMKLRQAKMKSRALRMSEENYLTYGLLTTVKPLNPHV